MRSAADAYQQAGIDEPARRARDGRGARLLHADRARPHGGPRLRRARHGLEGSARRHVRPRRRARRSTPTAASSRSATRSAHRACGCCSSAGCSSAARPASVRSPNGKTKALTHNLGGAPGACVSFVVGRRLRARLAQRRQRGVVQQPVRRQRAAAVCRATPERSVKRPPASSTITCTAARSHRLTVGSAARSNTPSATSTCIQKSPTPRLRHTRCASASNCGPLPCSRHELMLACPRCGVLEAIDGRHLQRALIARCAQTTRRPPPPAERGSRCNPHDDVALVLERDERPPDREPAHERRRAVDRIEDPPRARRRVADQALLLAEHRVIGSMLREQCAHRRFCRRVGVGDVRRIGLVRGSRGRRRGSGEA